MSLSHLKTRRPALYSLITASTLALAGCDGGVLNQSSSEGFSGDFSGPNRSADPLQGNLISARSADSTICFDVNLNGHCDRLEPNTKTASDGSFSLIPAKTPAPLLAELLADDVNAALTLFADSNSATISALTTVLHWSKKTNPTLPSETITEKLLQMLAIEDLDSVAPVETAIIELPSDETEGEDTAATTTTDGEAALASLAETSPLPSDHVDVVRQSIEKLIAKIDSAALSDALDAGLDPGMDINRVLLSRLVADQTLKQLPALAEAINDSINPDAQLLVDALPPIEWPADNIVLALQQFAGDLPTEADPSALLEDGLLGLMKVCKTKNDCALRSKKISTDDDLNLSVENFTLLADGSAVYISLGKDEVSNLVLSNDGEWEPLDTSGMASLTRASEYRAEMLDANDISFELRATSQNLRDTPVAPLLENLALSAGDLPAAQETFGSGAKLATLQRTQLDDRFEILFQPSQETLDRAAAAQALVQAEITLDRTQQDHAIASDTLRELQFASEQTTEVAAADALKVEALERALSAIESALAEANIALEEATANSAAIQESEELVAAYESVLLDATNKVRELEALESDALANVAEAELTLAEKEAALAAAITALVDAIAGAASDSETATEGVETDEATVAEPESDEEDNPAVIEAESLKLQAERDVIVADASLSEAITAAEDATAALAVAATELDNAETALANAQLQQLPDTDAEGILQGAQLLVSANETNLSLIEGQIAEAKLASEMSGKLASDDLAAMLSAQANADQLAKRLITATDDLSAAQSAVSSTELSMTNGCAEQLPNQAADNYNCRVLERRIGDSPSRVVNTLAELTSTSSTLTLLQLHADYAVSLLPALGASEGQVIWHGTDESYDPADATQIKSQWMQARVNGVQIMTVEVPAALREAGQASELLMAEQDNYVRPGIVVKAGEVVTETLLNEAALSALLP